jgi:hypothetical protein
LKDRMGRNDAEGFLNKKVSIPTNFTISGVSLKSIIPLVGDYTNKKWLRYFIQTAPSLLYDIIVYLFRCQHGVNRWFG